MVFLPQKNASSHNAAHVFGMRGATYKQRMCSVFAVAAINGKSGWVDGNPRQVTYQIMAVAAAWTLSIVGTVVLMKLTAALCGLLVSEEEEFDGLDVVLHGESGYNLEDDAFTLGSDEMAPPRQQRESVAIGVLAADA